MPHGRLHILLERHVRRAVHAAPSGRVQVFRHPHAPRLGNGNYKSVSRYGGGLPLDEGGDKFSGSHNVFFQRYKLLEIT